MDRELIERLRDLKRENQELKAEIAELKSRINRMNAKYRALKEQRPSEVDMIAKMMGMK